MKSSERHPRRAEQTRAELLEVAAQHFASGGYHGTSYGALIESSGLSKGAFYHHFRSKRELALAVYDAKQHAVKDAVDRAVEGIASPLERLIVMLRVRAELFETDRSLQCLPRLATDLAQLGGLTAQVTAGHRVPILWFREMLQDALAAGEIRKDLDLDSVARVLFSTLVGVNELSERESRGADQVARVDEVLTVFLALLGARSRGTRVPGARRARKRPPSRKASKR